ncbi:unnamed protein product [Rotaria sordida]|uniref:DYW domain-containing protein n=1 Tax=Rotaria sordida TaxID=392033 RepID=A0A819P5S4_9BILA|nr:unnamed protein product [Rotaria sordida]CAF4008505.1 unnamed protein product [Rotaria sordida]
MPKKLLNHRLTSRIVFVRLSVTIPSDFDLGIQMKLLNDKKQFKKALELFDTYMEKNNQTLSSYIITQALKACAQIGDFQRGSTIHHLIPSRTKDNSYVLTSLIHLYMQCGDVTRAQLLFDSASKKILQMYGAMMKGYIKNNMANKAIDLFNEIKDPDEIVTNLLFNVCAELKTSEALSLTKKVSSQMPKSFYSNLRLLTSLLDALIKCGDVTHAQSLFDASTKKILPMYGAMMKGYINNNMANKAIDLFNKIQNPDEVSIIILFNACAQLGTNEALNLTKKVSSQIPKSFHSNFHLLTSLLDALIQCGDCLNAEILFSKMKKSVIGYGNLMNGFLKSNNPAKILSLFNQMKIDNIEPDLIIYFYIIKALSQIGDYSLAQSIVEKIPNYFLINDKIQYALVNMWDKIGCIDRAIEIFEKIPEPNQIEYGSMINSYGLNGMGIQAVELYRQMSSEFMNESNYICVLNACSHSGLVDQARSIFSNIQIKTEKIYTTMIDCLSRASIFEEAHKLIDEFERDHSPALPMYRALLSGARNNRNIHLSQTIFDRIKKLFPELTNSLTSATVLLANVYASSGDIEKALDIRIQLTQTGAKKKAGLSWTIVNEQLFQFRAHDRSHPRSSEIYAELEKISKELIEHGHEYDSSWITRLLDKDETIESVLCGHSERLAIAWNFVVNPNATRIQVTKNLRVCGDCHQAKKLIAAIRQCEIIVRDANRIHHFYTNGQCSCNDYF